MKKNFLCLTMAALLTSASESLATPPADALGEFKGTPYLVAPTTVQPDYQLGPFDKISINVVGQKDLSVEKTQIDSSGNIVLPLVGVVTAGGKTASQLSHELEKMLGDKYLETPHVSVLIDEAISQRVTVSGAVIEPGVFNLKGRTSLMQAISMAKGPDNKVANLRHVAVFRQVAGHNARALFDLKAIEAGEMQDPEVLGGDSVVVEGSGTKTFWRELVGALPALGVFAYF